MEFTKDNFMKMIQDIDKNKKVSEENLPKVIAAKRLKFYKAIGKSDLIENKSEVNPDDENLSLKHLFFEPLIGQDFNSEVFDDSKLIEKFNNLKCTEFNLKDYINSVKWFYHILLDTNCGTVDFCFDFTLNYLLAHARDFNDPTKNLYTFSETGEEEIKFRDMNYDSVQSILPGDSKYVKTLNKLIADLLVTYNEDKYQQLNLNVTYLALLIARRIVKSEKECEKAFQLPKTHEDYATLCPMPFDSRLPIIKQQNLGVGSMNKTLNHLIIYGYTLSNRITRKIFRQTCINYMEYNGLVLVKHFYEVVRLYNTENYKLWDIMSKFNDCCEAMFILADLAHSQSEIINSNAQGSYNLFPFCRLLSQCYHSNLSTKNHKTFIACYALAMLIDLKLGLTKSFARKAHWTNSKSPIWTGKGEKIAQIIHRELTT